MKHDGSSEAWYVDWFDSPYYHILYKNRDLEEARTFLDHLIRYIEPASNASILDLACGRGRHALYLSNLGFEVTGVDLSEHSITYARKCSGESNNLRFEVHDIRHIYKENAFDVILNLFTSFGYFEDSEDHFKVLQSVVKGLKEGGLFVIDFLNSQKVLKSLPEKEAKTIEGIEFHVAKDLINNKICKQINFSDEGKDYQYKESIRAFTLKDLQGLFAEAGLEPIQCFGDYQLNPFDQDMSERLIIVGKKA